MPTNVLRDEVFWQRISPPDMQHRLVARDARCHGGRREGYRLVEVGRCHGDVRASQYEHHTWAHISSIRLI